MLSIPEKEEYEFSGIPGHKFLMKHDNSFKYNS